MVLQRIDSRRDEASGVLTDIYELREEAGGVAVHDLERIEAVLDGSRFRQVTAGLGQTVQATILDPEEQGDASVLQVRVQLDHHHCPELIEL